MNELGPQSSVAAESVWTTAEAEVWSSSHCWPGLDGPDCRDLDRGMVPELDYPGRATRLRKRLMRPMSTPAFWSANATRQTDRDAKEFGENAASTYHDPFAPHVNSFYTGTHVDSAMAGAKRDEDNYL